MIITVKSNADKDQLNEFQSWLTNQGYTLHPSQGANYTLIGVIGDTSALDARLIESLEIVDKVTRIQEPFKKANRKFHPQDTIVDIGGVKIGGGHFAIMAGPCSVETPEQVIECAHAVKAAGATILRGGAFKPRTSPYSFQGMGPSGLELLEAAKKETGLPIVSEVMDPSQLQYFDNVDMLQIGARNMQNFTLLKEVGKLRKPVLLKRGLSATYEEWLMAAEYIMSEGNEQIVLCERGIRTFETKTRNTLDVTAIPMMHELSHLPIIMDPSHAAGMSRMVRPLSLASTGGGADGLMIEVHNDPAKALCDGPQALRPDQFSDLTKDIFAMREIVIKHNLNK
ncbi:3-deoxy-7-phosphoheptulonate synthase [Veillonella sp. YH-vei2232]|uniref:3-deoxy-7-phosphoheptulonate synthase n=2 Tax=Veillonella TaxID=29465 RepID=A0ABU3Z6S0_9FIRM|nr:MULTISPECIES: 3-deoxy-7-phosphoheptulonate synthase [unclassified Veillonella]MDV5062973.1 3-deoxy-7-phosphoheptulonate synthase [Veillonella sp. YH-vei2232]MDV5087593.1 3-deoxy-7-phosphoheptulonate synthase [Veillonella sp. YH-vei2233]